MVMPVFNEERLLPFHLQLAAPHLDEIVLVDGSPDGPSTDNTRNLIKEANYDNVTVIEGKFALKGMKGGWDRGKQLKAGVDKAKGEVLIITSCDSVYRDYKHVVDTIRRFPDGKVYYCFSREFFIDTEHVRLINEGYPLPQVGYVIVKKKVFTTKNYTFFVHELVEPDERIYLQDVAKFHYGWVTDYKKQVAKHIRNVKNGGWGEYGENILAGGEQTLETWAIMHTSEYANEVVFPYAGNEGHPFDSLEFSYRDNFDEVLADFRNKYGKNYYDCVS